MKFGDVNSKLKWLKDLDIEELEATSEHWSHSTIGEIERFLTKTFGEPNNDRIRADSSHS